GPGDAPGSTSADDLQFNITWAYPGAFQVGQTISVTSGNMTGALRSGLVNRLNRSLFATIDDWLAAFNSTEPAARSLAMEDSRLVMFPIIDQAAIIYNGTGSAERVVISGFATYVVSQWSESGKQVYGYFVKSAYEGSVSPSGVNYGTLAYHLL
ncbi:MAG: hypothetical protein HY321_21010, partial [Armatimonadetes bacterium]|nr:hypothetical protein [Armatimonadota bacterium]